MIRVILCTHNGVQFLEEQLASIMAQQHPVDVVHLFDFGSSDGTPELARQLASRWPKIEVRTVAEAPGVTLSFFYAFREVESECAEDDVIFLSDQDDVWLPEKTHTMLTRLEAERSGRSDLVLLFHDVRICDETLRILRTTFYDGQPFRLPRDMDRSRLLIANPAIGHTMVFTRALMSLAVANLRAEHYVMHDWALVLLASRIGRLIFVNERLSLYRQHGGNILGARRKRTFSEYVARAKKLSAAVLEQVAAFEKDVGNVAKEHGALGALVPGVGPVNLRISGIYLMKGHTIGHRLAAVLPLVQWLSPSERVKPS